MLHYRQMVRLVFGIFDIISQLACDKKDDVSPVKILEYHFGICVERH